MISNIKSTIESVMVYRSGALVTRSASVHLKAGRHLLNLTELSKQIVQESIQVELSDGLYCNQVTLCKKQREEEDTEISSLEKQKSLLENKLSIYNNIYEALKRKVLPATENSSDVKYMQEYLVFYTQKMQEILDERLELTESIDSLKNEIAAAKEKRMSENTGVISLDLTADCDTEGFIRISFYEQGASWSPFYNIYVDHLDAPIRFELKGKIIQTTGEDWSNVQLSLSTGNLSVSNNQPELKPWYLPKTFGSRQFAALANVGETTLLSASAPEFIPPNRSNSDREDEQTSMRIEYRVREKCTIPSDQNGSVVQIQRQEFPAEYIYYITPKAEKSAFLMAYLDDWQQHNFLNCDANIFLGKRYMGATYIDTSCIDKKMKISLGRDEEILVDRKIVKKFTSTTPLRGLAVKDCEYGLQVINTKKEKINVQIIDQIPISRNEKIFVECKEISGAKLNQEDGRLTWDYCIYDNHKVDLTVAFRIKCPKEMMDSVM